MHITSIHQLLPIIEKKPEFIVMDKGEYQVIDYVYQDQNTFDDPKLMECRGIKFCKDGLILARPFRKFFNFGENGSGLPIHRPHVITEKLDGSMVHPIIINGGLSMHTRKGHTDVAKKAERFCMTHPGHLQLSMDAIRAGWTPIFEYVGPNNRIVLRYDNEDLVLLAMRHIIEGRLVSYAELQSWGDSYDVNVVEPPTLYGRDLKDVNAFIKHTRELQDAEGYVVYFDDGYMVKVKADEYVLKHRALDDMNSKKKVVALCAQGFMDDVLPTLDLVDREELLSFNDKVQIKINQFVWKAKDLVGRHQLGHLGMDKKESRKRFAIHVAPRIEPKWMTAVHFGILDGKDPRKMVIDALIKNPDDLGIPWRGQ